MKRAGLSNKNILLSKPSEYLAVFLTGGVIYYLIEILWRGYSHLIMFAAGGLCLLFIHISEKKLGNIRLMARCVIYGFAITAVEFITGIVCNIILGLGIWDYSDMPFNILGQVCPSFILAWIAISLPAIFICNTLATLFDIKRNQIA